MPGYGLKESNQGNEIFKGIAEKWEIWREREREREIITFDYCFIFYSVLYYDSKLVTPSNYWRREPDKEK